MPLTVYCRLGAINCENRTFSLFAMLGKLSQKHNLCSSENNCLSSSQIYNKQHKVNQRGFSSFHHRSEMCNNGKISHRAIFTFLLMSFQSSSQWKTNEDNINTKILRWYNGSFLSDIKTVLFDVFYAQTKNWTKQYFHACIKMITSTAKFLWAAQTTTETACKLM